MGATQTVPLGYETKSDDYFEFARPEMASHVPARCHRILDVGCGTGSFGELLKRSRNVEIWGVEPVKAAAARASARLDRVINSNFDAETKLPAGAFDCIVFNDVLEHMAAPEQALRYAKIALAEGGAIVASIPNIRYLPVLWRLVYHAEWEYRDLGVLDKTHLRFFTKSSIIKMFQSEGYDIESISAINAYGSPPRANKFVWRAHRVANALFRGKFADMKFAQFAVVARAASPQVSQ